MSAIDVVERRPAFVMVRQSSGSQPRAELSIAGGNRCARRFAQSPRCVVSNESREPDVPANRHLRRRRAARRQVAASTDAWLLDNCPHWVCLPDTVGAQAGVSPWILDLG